MKSHRTSHSPLLTASSLVLLAGIAALQAGGCAEPPRSETGTVRMVAGILPYADIAAQIGGEHVTVDLLIPPGKDPHTFDLDPRRMQNVHEADIVVFNGAGLEMWAERIAEELPGTTRVLWADGLLHDSLIHEAVTNHDHAHEGHVHEGGVNPHLWLDPVFMKRVGMEIRDALIAADPKREAAYQKRADAFLARLDSLDDGIRAGVAQWRSRAFVTAHPAWAYFCKRYGLREAAVLEAGPGKEISAKEMAAIAQRMRAEGLEVIFTQFMFPDAVAQALARETGARTAELDTHGSNNTAVHYIELMKHNFDIMNSVMR